MPLAGGGIERGARKSHAGVLERDYVKVKTQH
jgi:hypothetical protein